MKIVLICIFLDLYVRATAEYFQRKEFVRQQKCMFRVDSGPCQEQHEVYGFDPFSNICSKFTYGGCGGNPNRFKNYAECSHECIIRKKEVEEEPEDVYGEYGGEDKNEPDYEVKEESEEDKASHSKEDTEELSSKEGSEQLYSKASSNENESNSSEKSVQGKPKEDSNESEEEEYMDDQEDEDINGNNDPRTIKVKNIAEYVNPQENDIKKRTKRSDEWYKIKTVENDLREHGGVMADKLEQEEVNESKTNHNPNQNRDKRKK